MEGICGNKKRIFIGLFGLCAVLTFLCMAYYDIRLPTVKHMTSLVDRTGAVILRGTGARDKNQGIPKRIHQIWNDDLIPEVFQENIRGLVAHNKPPGWSYHFWTLATGQRFLKEKFPTLEVRFSKAANLLKADILRLAILYHFGGVYFDLDTVSVKPLDPYVETHNCSFVTDPPEHVFNINNEKKKLLITNSAMLCAPNNWFIMHAIEQLAVQAATCRDAVSCTGPYFISKLYEQFQGTNRSADLPIVEDFRLFEDKFDHSIIKNMNTHCKEPLTALKHDWSREVCKQWISRGREKRNISELAFTYHTWFHTYYSTMKAKLNAGVKRKITEIVPNVTFYPFP